MKHYLFLAGAAIAFLLGGPAAQPRAAESSYHLVPNWAPLPGGEAWGEVPGIAIGKNGTIYAFRRAEPPIIELNAAGKIQKTWGQNMFVWPHGFRVDRDGNLWATDGRAANGRGQQVFKMTPDGKILLTLGTKGVSGDGPDTFNGPCDVAFGANGDIFVADGHVNARVVKFSKDGKFIKAWGKKGSAPGEFNVPHAIAIDSQGRIFVADRSNRRIQLFDQGGKFLDQWAQFGAPSGLFIAPDDTLYAANASEMSDKKGIVVGSAKDGTVRFTMPETLPEGVAVDRDGSVYSGETTTGHTIRKLVR